MKHGSLARFALVIGSSAVLGAAACGRSSDFSATANSLCSAYQAKAKRIPKPTSPSEIPGYADRALPGARAFVAKLDALTPPSDKRAAYEAYLAGAHRELVDLAGAAEDIRAGKMKPSAVFSRRLSLQVRLDNAAATALGLEQCAKG